MGGLRLWSALISFNTLFFLSTARDTVSPNQPLTDNQTLISAGGIFELGFFSPGSTSNRYLGIWYTSAPTNQVVWVANRENPINGSTAILKLGTDGSLILLSNERVIWSTVTKGANVLHLLDSGNLILQNDSKNLIWQSFDHPTHAMLAGMKIGRDFRTNHEWTLTSWKTEADPSPGAYSYRVYSEGLPDSYVANGSIWTRRSGIWTGHGWNDIPSMSTNKLFEFNLISNHDQLYYTYEVRNKSTAASLVLDPDGFLVRQVFLRGHWSVYWKLPADVCDPYAVCGAYGVCQIDGSPTAYCTCLRGFKPKADLEWGMRDWSGGCMRTEALGCEKEDGFFRVGQLKLPDTRNTSWDKNKGVDECRKWCLQNCSCQAFAVTGEGGSGCITWFGELLDIREFTQGGEDLYVRGAASKIVDEGLHHKKRSTLVIKCAVISSATLLLISLCLFWVRRRKGKTSQKQVTINISGCSQVNEVNVYNGPSEVSVYNGQSDDVTKDSGLPLFTFSCIIASTNNFSDKNKIGEGGFGPVYKGILMPQGYEIAVKRLSKGSVQGVDEFKNEIKLIANLQHKNLVRLLGCCIQDEERILVYEYMSNRSLDHFLFDPHRSASLDWKTRIRVINGVAQGLLYLHTYSRLRIIHRDLKSGNILLDSEMNPKISDFGIARIFGGKQDLANTNRIIGTYGYMPPEYAIGGCFSEKSDVFSFGVLLLEIVSGKKNYGDPKVGHSRFLTGHVWQLWRAGRVSEMMDRVLHQSCPLQDLIRYVHLGLLCVQEEASERPAMSTVVSFLNSELLKLPKPKRVAFSKQRWVNVDSSIRVDEFFSTNELTITAPSPR